MNKRIKIILNYLLTFILSILVFLLTTLIIFKTSIYNPDFVKNKFIENNYYSNLSQSISEEMSNYIVQSGFPEEILNDIFTEQMVEESINHIIDTAYTKDAKISVDTTKIEENLNKNIADYLQKNNIEITDQESLSKFVDQIAEVYRNEVSLANATEYLQKIITKTTNILTIAIIVIVVIIIVLAIIITKLKENAISIPLLTSGLLAVIGNFYVNNNISVNNIYIWDSNISAVLQSILSDILNKFNTYGIIFIVIGCLAAVVEALLRKTNKKVKKEKA